MIELTITSDPFFKDSVGKSGKTTAEALTAKGNTIRVGWWAYKGIKKGDKIFASKLEERTYTPSKGKNAGVEQTEYTVTFPKGEYPDQTPPDSYGSSNGGGNGGGGFASPVMIFQEPHICQKYLEVLERSFERVAFARAMDPEKDYGPHGLAELGMSLALIFGYENGTVTLDGAGVIPSDTEEIPPVEDDLPY